uniref:Envelopment polyprotein n=1 Tax=Oropouche virus TaxID=118655 RepID=A0A3Q8G908_9VIRU|nr:glycopolyprotein [Oropouche virus]
MANLIIISMVLGVAYGHPLSTSQIGDRCFAGGNLFKEMNLSVGLGEICVKDDISIVKSTTVFSKNKPALEATTKFYRSFIVKDWSECNPVLDKFGNFMVLNVDDNGHIVPKMYTCRAACDIRLNKDNAEIILSSTKLNHFEIVGTTSTSGWFKNTITNNLEHTCEHVTVNCGQKSVKFHACFRQHRGCIRFFKGTYMPYSMIEAMCVNIELIILTLYIFAAIIFALIITKSYVAYLLLPLFYPVTWFYGKVYKKINSCPNCLLASHPFTSCPKFCICGSRFSCTEALKVHRMGKDCLGYKSLSKARQMCKSKSWSFTAAILTGLILMEFISPIAGERMYKLEELADEFIKLTEQVNILEREMEVLKQSIIVMFAIILVLLLFENMIFNRLFRIFYRSCSMCGLIHYRPGLKIDLTKTNRCGSCICGFDEQQSSGFEYEIFLKDMHVQKESCKFSPRVNHFRNIKALLFALVICATIYTVYADEDCLSKDIKITYQELHNCIGPKIMGDTCVSKSELYSDLFSKNLVTEYDKKYFEPDTVNDQFNKIEFAQDAHRMILLESILYKTECEMLSLKKNSGPYNVAWRTYLKNHNIDLCSRHNYKMICQCINTHSMCNNTDIDYNKEIETYYKSNAAAYRADLNTIMDTLKTAFRGLTKVLIENYIEKDDSDALKALFSNITDSVQDNYQMIGILKFASKLLDINLGRSTRSAHHSIMTNEIPKSNPFTDYSYSNLNIKECMSPESLKCFKKRDSTPHTNHLLCKIDNKYKAFDWPEIETIQKGQKLCLGDSHCNLEFTAITADKIMSLTNCYKESFTAQPADMQAGIKKCSADEIGECTTLEDKTWPIVFCGGKYYYSDSKEHAKDGSINNYCLTNKCSEQRFPIHENWFKKCNWDKTHKEFSTMRQINYNDITSYRKAIESEIGTDLMTHHYKPTKNLPHVVPRYHSIDVQGTESTEGIINGFIQNTIPAISGLGVGYHLNFQSNQLFDIVIFVKKAVYKAQYQKAYTTGPSISINIEHNERCTGHCPEKIPAKEGWLTFSKEHTSSWGCEEYGCLAIDTGCLYGSCQDVIRPELDVYKKIGSEVSLIEICITLPHETYCNDMDILEPIIGDKLSASFQNTQTNQLPTLIAYKKGKIYTGQINDIGNTALQCGSIQVINGSTIGTGSPKFDYICHAMRRKDVIVRKCFNDNYQSCTRLEKRNDLIPYRKGDVIEVSKTGSNMGQMTFKIELGDINYKIFTKSIDLQMSGICAGCIDCAEGISCSINAEVPAETVCHCKTNCEDFINNIVFSPQIKNYNIKVHCKSKVEKITAHICGRDIDLQLTIKPYNQKIDLSQLDESNYIREEDLQCGTWLCKVQKEGVDIIFKGLFSGLGRYWTILIYSIIGVVIIVILVYILLPIGRLLKAFLIRHEIEYAMEQKIK